MTRPVADSSNLRTTTSAPTKAATATAATSSRELFTAEQVSEYLGGVVRAGTLENWRYQKRRVGPRFVKLGGKVRYDRADVDKWIEERKRA